MTLQEIFDQLTGGELVQTNLNEITEDSQSKVVNHINLGLSDLFTRFFLREGRLMLLLIADQLRYPIDAKYAVANKRSRVDPAARFILDSAAEPFASDVLKVEAALTDAGVTLDLDDTDSRWSLTTSDTAPPTLRVPADIVNQARELPDPLKTSQIEVVYRARHPKIVLDTVEDAPAYTVRLPDTHLQALLFYVASRVLGPTGLGQQEGVSSVGYWKRYEAECEKLAGSGLQLSGVDRFHSPDKLRDRGFV